MSDSLHARRTTKEVERIKAIFDYTHHQEAARKEKEIASLDKQLQDTDIYKKLEASRQNGTKLTIEELRESRKLVLENLPDFSSLLMSKEYKMSQKDFDLCVLFRLGFKSKEVSNMLGLTQGRVSQICTKLLRDVFKKDEGGAAELINILHEWC